MNKKELEELMFPCRMLFYEEVREIKISFYRKRKNKIKPRGRNGKVHVIYSKKGEKADETN
jgi:hypothetical protein